MTNEVHYVYDGRVVIQERDANNLPLVTYTRGNDLSGTSQGAGGIGGLLARTDNGLLAIGDSRASAFYHCDGNGNVTALIGTNQLVAARYSYDPFGNTLSASGPLAGANLYRFSSKEFHPNSGLVYYLYRFYDPNLQRWLNKDPLGERGGLNLFSFVGSDPINGSDFFGECPLALPLLVPVAEAALDTLVAVLAGTAGYLVGDAVIRSPSGSATVGQLARPESLSIVNAPPVITIFPTTGPGRGNPGERRIQREPHGSNENGRS